MRDVLPSLTGDDLKEMGVATVGDRRRLLEGDRRPFTRLTLGGMRKLSRNRSHVLGPRRKCRPNAASSR